MQRNWLVASPITDEERRLFPELPPLLLQLLWNRGLKTQEDIDKFLNPDYATDLHDPFLFRDMERAVERLQRAIESKEKIVIHGDYDADGVCASVILWTTFKALGAVVDVFLPHRENDGYGLNAKTVEHLAREEARVIITCDCGISNAKEIALASDRGIDVIITDHHTIPPELPKAYAILHPLVEGETYPGKGLSGGGVAFKLAQGLVRRLQTTDYGLQLEPGYEKWLLDLAAISSVADMVPLRGETRTIVKYGLIVLDKTRRPGLRKLFRQKPDTTTIGFQIAPRINAAGRMSHANTAFRLLTTDDSAEADRLAAELEENNAARQVETRRITEEARSKIVAAKHENDSAIVATGRGWPLGLLGLVAGKLADEFYRPTIVLADRDGEFTGSARSIPEVDIMTILRSMPELIIKFGGHPQAAGMTIAADRIEEFTDQFRNRIGNKLLGIELVPKIAIDADISIDEITWDLYEQLSKLAPFGIGNPEPKYRARGLTVHSAEPVGALGKHLRLLVSEWKGPRTMIGFNCGEWCARLSPGDRIDAVFTIGVNEWNGNRELELKIVDLNMHYANDANELCK